MKTIITLFAMTLGFGAMAQEEQPTVVTIEDGSEIGCIIWPKSIKPVVFVWDADTYYRNLLRFPSWDAINPFGYNQEARYHFDEDLPFVQVLTTGSIYSFDYIRNTARP
jgi:hypothetical protein